jgi:hypothetical protein
MKKFFVIWLFFIIIMFITFKYTNTVGWWKTSSGYTYFKCFECSHSQLNVLLMLFIIMHLIFDKYIYIIKRWPREFFPLWTKKNFRQKKNSIRHSSLHNMTIWILVYYSHRWQLDNTLHIYIYINLKKMRKVEVDKLIIRNEHFK